MDNFEQLCKVILFPYLYTVEANSSSETRESVASKGESKIYFEFRDSPRMVFKEPLQIPIDQF